MRGWLAAEEEDGEKLKDGRIGCEEVMTVACVGRMEEVLWQERRTWRLSLFEYSEVSEGRIDLFVVD